MIDESSPRQHIFMDDEETIVELGVGFDHPSEPFFRARILTSKDRTIFIPDLPDYPDKRVDPTVETTLQVEQGYVVIGLHGAKGGCLHNLGFVMQKM